MNKPSSGKNFTPACPIPAAQFEKILLGHGSGGKMTHDLVEKIFMPAFGNEALQARHDGALLEAGGAELAFTTDSYVVKPIFFPGGDIGRLSVFGTLNDLAMCGARPLWLSAGFILEEGFAVEDLRRIVTSMKEACESAKVTLVTADTKVVDRGKADGIFINTAGIGIREKGVRFEPSKVQPGDKVLLSGDIGRHGMAIMTAREGLEFESVLESDAASLVQPVQSLLEKKIKVHCLRDLTRGGLATALVEIAKSRGLGIEIDESKIPVSAPVRGACEVLGLDPLYAACEGRMVAFVPAGSVDSAMKVLKSFNAEAIVIGEVKDQQRGVRMHSLLGTGRYLDMLSGEQLPRIC